MDKLLKENNTTHVGLVIRAVKDLMATKEQAGYIINREIVEDILDIIKNVYDVK